MKSLNFIIILKADEAGGVAMRHSPATVKTFTMGQKVSNMK